METAEKYRQYAAECLRLAQKAPELDDRSRLVQMAQAWRDLADKVETHDPKSE